MPQKGAPIWPGILQEHSMELWLITEIGNALVQWLYDFFGETKRLGSRKD